MAIKPMDVGWTGLAVRMGRLECIHNFGRKSWMEETTWET